MNRELFVVEKLLGDDWVPRPSLVSLSPFLNTNAVDSFAAVQRITRYVPEDDTPRLLAAWQSKTDGKVRWVSTDNGILCVLKADTRRAAGDGEPLDPFGAARDALAKWESQWGQT